MQSEQAITLDFLNITSEDVTNELLATGLKLHTRAAKVKALDKLGITVADEQAPLEAWVKAMCRKNGLPEKLPAHEIGNAAMELCSRWVFWLA